MNPGSRYGRPLALGLAAAVVLLIPLGSVATKARARQEAHRAPVEQTVTAKKYSFSPARIEVQQDDIVKITFQTDDIPHSFTIDSHYKIAKRASPGHPVTFEFRAHEVGTFTYYCNLTSDDGCRHMKGELVVRAKPAAGR